LERGYGHEFTVDNSYVYKLALQFITAIFTTNSAVDYAKTPDELSFLLVLQVLSFFFASLIVASIISLVQDATKASKEFQERNISLKQFLHGHGVPLSLQLRASRFLYFKWKARSFVPAEESLADLPDDLISDVILHMRASHLRRHRFFKDLDTDALRQISLMSNEVFYMEGDELVKYGSNATSAFFLTRGTVEIIPSNDAIPPKTLAAPAWFGDLSLFNPGIVRAATVRALDATSAIEVEQNVIADVCTRFPHMDRVYADFVAEAKKDREAFLTGRGTRAVDEEEVASGARGLLVLAKRGLGYFRKDGKGNTAKKKKLNALSRSMTSAAKTVTVNGEQPLANIEDDEDEDDEDDDDEGATFVGGTGEVLPQPNADPRKRNSALPSVLERVGGESGGSSPSVPSSVP
jgi:CRP-like cAMP-binding protein